MEEVRISTEDMLAQLQKIAQAVSQVNQGFAATVALLGEGGPLQKNIDQVAKRGDHAAKLLREMASGESHAGSFQRLTGALFKYTQSLSRLQDLAQNTTPPGPERPLTKADDARRFLRDILSTHMRGAQLAQKDIQRELKFIAKELNEGRPVSVPRLLARLVHKFETADAAQIARLQKAGYLDTGGFQRKLLGVDRFEEQYRPLIENIKTLRGTLSRAITAAKYVTTATNRPQIPYTDLKVASGILDLIKKNQDRLAAQPVLRGPGADVVQTAVKQLRDIFKQFRAEGGVVTPQLRAERREMLQVLQGLRNDSLQSRSSYLGVSNLVRQAQEIANEMARSRVAQYRGQAGISTPVDLPRKNLTGVVGAKTFAEQVYTALVRRLPALALRPPQQEQPRISSVTTGQPHPALAEYLRQTGGLYGMPAHISRSLRQDTLAQQFIRPYKAKYIIGPPHASMDPAAMAAFYGPGSRPIGIRAGGLVGGHRGDTQSVDENSPDTRGLGRHSTPGRQAATVIPLQQVTFDFASPIAAAIQRLVRANIQRFGLEAPREQLLYGLTDLLSRPKLGQLHPQTGAQYLGAGTWGSQILPFMPYNMTPDDIPLLDKSMVRQPGVLNIGRGPGKTNMLTPGIKPWQPGWLGNPYEISSNVTREQAVARHMQALNQMLANPDFLRAFSEIPQRYQAIVDPEAQGHGGNIQQRLIAGSNFQPTIWRGPQFVPEHALETLLQFQRLAVGRQIGQTPTLPDTLSERELARLAATESLTPTGILSRQPTAPSKTSLRSALQGFLGTQAAWSEIAQVAESLGYTTTGARKQLAKLAAETTGKPVTPRDIFAAFKPGRRGLAEFMSDTRGSLNLSKLWQQVSTFLRSEVGAFGPSGIPSDIDPRDIPPTQRTTARYDPHLGGTMSSRGWLEGWKPQISLGFTPTKLVVLDSETWGLKNQAWVRELTGAMGEAVVQFTRVGDKVSTKGTPAHLTKQGALFELLGPDLQGLRLQVGTGRKLMQARADNRQIFTGVGEHRIRPELVNLGYQVYDPYSREPALATSEQFYLPREGARMMPGLPHGLDLKTLLARNAGTFTAETANKLLQAWGPANQTVFMGANPNFDMSILSAMMADVGVAMPQYKAINTTELFRLVNMGLGMNLPNLKMDTVLQALGVTSSVGHHQSALEDINLLQQALARVGIRRPVDPQLLYKLAPADMLYEEGVSSAYYRLRHAQDAGLFLPKASMRVPSAADVPAIDRTKFTEAENKAATQAFLAGGQQIPPPKPPAPPAVSFPGPEPWKFNFNIPTQMAVQLVRQIDDAIRVRTYRSQDMGRERLAAFLGQQYQRPSTRMLDTQYHAPSTVNITGRAPAVNVQGSQPTVTLPAKEPLRITDQRPRNLIPLHPAPAGTSRTADWYTDPQGATRPGARPIPPDSKPWQGGFFENGRWVPAGEERPVGSSQRPPYRNRWQRFTDAAAGFYDKINPVESWHHKYTGEEMNARRWSRARFRRDMPPDDALLASWHEAQDRGYRAAQLKQARRWMQAGGGAIPPDSRFGGRGPRGGGFMGGLAGYMGLHLVVGQYYRLIGAMSQSIAKAAEFQIQLARIQTISSQAAQMGIGPLAESVVNLGVRWGQLPQTTAEAVYLAISNQLHRMPGDFFEGIPGATTSYQKALNFVGDSAEFGRAAATPVDAAAESLASVLNAYQLGAGAAPQVGAELFKTIELGRIIGPQMRTILGRVMPLASEVGVDRTEILAGIAHQTIQGMKPEESITLMSNLLLRLIKPTKEMGDEMERLGIMSTSLAVRGRGLQGFLEHITEYSGHAAENLGGMFGRIRAVRGAISLVGRSGETYAEIQRRIAEVTPEDLKSAADFVTAVPGTEYQVLKARMDAYWTNQMGPRLLDWHNYIMGSLGPENVADVGVTAAMAGLGLAGAGGLAKLGGAGKAALTAAGGWMGIAPATTGAAAPWLGGLIVAATAGKLALGYAQQTDTSPDKVGARLRDIEVDAEPRRRQALVEASFQVRTDKAELKAYARTLTEMFEQTGRAYNQDIANATTWATGIEAVFSRSIQGRIAMLQGLIGHLQTMQQRADENVVNLRNDMADSWNAASDAVFGRSIKNLEDPAKGHALMRRAQMYMDAANRTTDEDRQRQMGQRALQLATQGFDLSGDTMSLYDIENQNRAILKRQSDQQTRVKEQARVAEENNRTQLTIIDEAYAKWRDISPYEPGITETEYAKRAQERATHARTIDEALQRITIPDDAPLRDRLKLIQDQHDLRAKLIDPVTQQPATFEEASRNFSAEFYQKLTASGDDIVAALQKVAQDINNWRITRGDTPLEYDKLTGPRRLPQEASEMLADYGGTLEGRMDQAANIEMLATQTKQIDLLKNQLAIATTEWTERSEFSQQSLPSILALTTEERSRFGLQGTKRAFSPETFATRDAWRLGKGDLPWLTRQDEWDKYITKITEDRDKLSTKSWFQRSRAEQNELTQLESTIGWDQLRRRHLRENQPLQRFNAINEALDQLAQAAQTQNLDGVRAATKRLETLRPTEAEKEQPWYSRIKEVVPAFDALLTQLSALTLDVESKRPAIAVFGEQLDDVATGLAGLKTNAEEAGAALKVAMPESLEEEKVRLKQALDGMIEALNAAKTQLQGESEAKTMQFHGGPGQPQTSTPIPATLTPYGISSTAYDATVNALKVYPPNQIRAAMAQVYGNWTPVGKTGPNLPPASLATGAQVLRDMFPQGMPPFRWESQASQTTYNTDTGQIILGQDAVKTPFAALAHESIHGQQRRLGRGWPMTPAGLFAAESSATIGGYLAEYEARRRSSGLRDNNMYELAPGVQYSLEQLRNMANQHGMYQGVPIQDLLATPMGQQFLKRIIEASRQPGLNTSAMFGQPQLSQMAFQPQSQAHPAMYSTGSFGFGGPTTTLIGRLGTVDPLQGPQTNAQAFTGSYSTGFSGPPSLSLASHLRTDQTPETGPITGSIEITRSPAPYAPPVFGGYGDPKLLAIDPTSQSLMQLPPAIDTATQRFMQLDTGLTTVTDSISSVLQQLAAAAASAATTLASIQAPAPQANAQGGLIQQFAAGGDVVNAALTPGEFVMNPRSTQRWYPTIQAMNRFDQPRFAQGGDTTNIGDVIVNINSTNANQINGRQVANAIRRELRTKTARL